MRKITIILLLSLLLLTGCRRETQTQCLPSFTCNGVTISMNAEAGPVLYHLGRPQDFSFTLGKDQTLAGCTYRHPGFHITTYPMGDTEYISGVYFRDSSVATPEGIRIGDSREAVERAYGPGSIQGNTCIQTLGNTRRTILLTAGTVSAVEYEVVLE